MKREINPSHLSSYLLWGGSAIILALLIALISHYYLNTREQYQQQLYQLQQDLLEQQRNRLKTELDDAERYIQLNYQQAEKHLMLESKAQTRQALQLMDTLYQRYHQQLPEAEMKQMLVESVRNIRFFKNRGYYFIDDMEGICILLPTAPQIEGKSLYDNQDDTGHYIMRGLIEAVSNPDGAGFSRYRWYPPGNKVSMADKIAYVELFKPYNWIVGTGDYLYRFQDDLQPHILHHIRNIRFGKNGYIAVINESGVVLASAGAPTLENMHYNQFGSYQDQISIRQILKSAEAGGGFISYDWYRPGSADSVQKISLVRPLNRWGWILVAGFYEDDLDLLLQEQQRTLDEALEQNENSLIFSILVIGAIALLITRYYGGWLRGRFNSYHQSLTAQQKALQKTAESLQLSGRVVESAYEGIAVCDANNRIIQVNSAFSRITGYSEDEVIGKEPTLLASGRHSEEFYQHMWDSLKKQGYWRGEIWNRRKSGEVYPEWLSIIVSCNDQGEVQNYIATFTDITQRKELENQLRHLAETDPLTGLANRRTLMFCLNHDLAAVNRYMSADIALMFIDLDHFKAINDNYGHDLGDKVLLEVAKRLQANVRESDLACRFGGDEFVVLVKLEAGEDEQHLELMAARILRALSLPISSDPDLRVGCSIGVAVRRDSDDAFALMKNADEALYEAKSRGRGQIFFSGSDTMITG